MRQWSFYLCCILASLAIVLAAEDIDEKKPSIDEELEKTSTLTLDEMLGNDVMIDEESVLVELDMVFPAKTYREIVDESEEKDESKRRKRQAVRDRNLRWTNGVIPYDTDMNLKTDELKMIKEAMAEYEKHTCIKFQPAKRADNHTLRFQKTLVDNNCRSSVGMQSSKMQILYLNRDCSKTKGVIIHEIGHAIGLHHEQTRPNRDDFICIEEKNVKDDKLRNFRKYKRFEQFDYNLPYDYTSIMHYGEDFFSREKGVMHTMIARNPAFQKEMGQRDRLSDKDIALINSMYRCSHRRAKKLSRKKARRRSRHRNKSLTSGALQRLIH